MISNCMEINDYLYFQAQVRNAKVCLPLSPPATACRPVTRCYLHLAEKCTTESGSDQETEEVVTERDVLDPTGRVQHMLPTDASQFSLGLCHRQLTKPYLRKTKESGNAAGVVSMAALRCPG